MKKAMFNIQHQMASLRRISINTRQSHLATDSAQKTRILLLLLPIHLKCCKSFLTIVFSFTLQFFMSSLCNPCSKIAKQIQQKEKRRKSKKYRKKERK